MIVRSYAYPSAQAVGFVLVLLAGFAGCGGDDGEPVAGGPAIAPEDVPMMPEPRREDPIPVGQEHYRDALAELENQLAVEWVEHDESNLYIGVVRAAYKNDTDPVVAAALRVHKTKGEPITAYVVDASVAKKGWRPGSDGLVDTLKMPLELKFGGIGDDDPPTDQ